jgi:hypothetical protein
MKRTKISLILNRLLAGLGWFIIILLAGLSLAFGDWTDAGWNVWYESTCGAGSNVVEVVNMNKLSFRKYAFNRLTGALKRISWNTSKAEEFYVNGESEITLSPNANSLSSTHDRMLTLSAPLREPSTMDDGSLRYAFNFSIPLY